VQEAKLAEEQARGLHSFNRRDLPVELEELRGMLHHRDIPLLSKMVQEVLAAASHILECL
jgi:hypothetical protein